MPDFLLNHIRIIYKTRIEINITIIYTNTPWLFSLAPSLPSHLKSKRKTIHNNPVKVVGSFISTNSS